MKCKKCNKEIYSEFQKCTRIGSSFMNQINLICDSEKPNKIFKKIYDKNDLEFKNCQIINNLNQTFLLNYFNHNDEGIIYNYIEGDILYDFLIFYKEPSIIYDIFKKIFNCLLKLESIGYNHFDISPRNILIDTNNNVFIIDYSYLIKKEELNNLPEFVGSYGYIPLEFAKNKKKVFNKFDIFSFGILLFEAVFKYKIFIGGKNYTKKCWIFCKDEKCNRDECLKKYVINNLPKNLDKKVYNFYYYSLIYSLKEDPEERFDFRQLNDYINMSNLNL